MGSGNCLELDLCDDIIDIRMTRRISRASMRKTMTRSTIVLVRYMGMGLAVATMMRLKLSLERLRKDTKFL